MIFGNSVNEYYVEKIRMCDAVRAKRLSKIKTADDAHRYVVSVKRKIASIFSFPDRTPLDPVITGVNEYGDYRVENLYYFSRPHYPVTANLYLPVNRKGKVPGVLFLCGHAMDGKASDVYRSACIGLVKKGFGVLIVDPVEQGERKQYIGTEAEKAGLCPNHNMMGKQMALVGEWLGAWRTWDAVRGIDYLETRLEIDAKRIMVTGNSGGGTLTAFVAAVDPRPIAVAPSCYITSWLHNIENELPADIEQIPPMILEQGMEMGDLLLAQAPRNMLLLGQRNDFFDARGTAETYAEVKRINALLGAKTELFIGPVSHGYSIHNREAMYSFFIKQARLRGVTANEAKFDLPSEKDTYVAGGDVMSIPCALNIRDLIASMVKKTVALRAKLSRDELRKHLMEELRLGPQPVPHYRVLRFMWHDGIYLARFALETEPGRPMAVLMHNNLDELYHIADASRDVTLFIPDLDGARELEARKVKKGETVYALDVRSIGEMMPSGTDQPDVRDFYAPYQSDYHYASVGIMFGESMLSRKVKDIMSAIALLKSKGAKKIHLEGCGLGAVPALMAAVLSDDVSDFKYVGAYKSYAEEACKISSRLPLSCVQPGILKFTDIAEMLRAVHSCR